MYSVQLASRVQIYFTAAKLLALAIIIVGGIYRLCAGKCPRLSMEEQQACIVSYCIV